MTNMITKGKDKPKKKSVLLFSGGMDSLIMNYLLKPDVLLVIPHGNKYEKKEMECISTLIKKKIIDKKKVVFDDSLQLGQYERDDAIIPNRNLYFVTLATHYGETIYLGSVYGDRSLDKSKVFFKKCEDMFNYLFQDQHWCKGRTFSISAPFKNLTKTELVKLYLSKKGSEDALLESYSCYDGKNKPCGVCKPCCRKNVALTNNNIKTNNYFVSEFYEAEWFKKLLPLIKKNKYRGREDSEILKAVKKLKDEKNNN